MAQDSPLDIVTAYQDAWLSGNFVKARDFLADDMVFQSPQQRITSVSEFLPMLTAFAKRIAPKWKLISATVNGEDLLILYQIFTLDDTPATCADYFTVRSGKIQSETLAFDPAPFQPR